MTRIFLPKEILEIPHSTQFQQGKIYMRNGIPLEKGAILTPQRVEKNLELYKKYYEFWSVYPDRFLQLLLPSNSKFKLKFFQILFLRACLRHGRILTIAPRAAGKSFICILALMLICIFRPGSHVFLCSPGKAQGAKIAGAKIKQLFEIYPLLKEEIVGEGNYGADYVKNLMCILVIR